MTATTFLILRTCLICLMTLGMMASLTEFRFGIRKLLGVLGLYLLWVLLSTWALLRLGGEVLLLRMLLLTISAPAVVLTYWAAKDTPSQAVFNYTTQILVSLLRLSGVRSNHLSYRPFFTWSFVFILRQLPFSLGHVCLDTLPRDKLSFLV